MMGCLAQKSTFRTLSSIGITLIFVGCGASSETSSHGSQQIKYQNVPSEFKLRNNGTMKLSFGLANDRDLEVLIKIEKCFAGTTLPCEPIKGKAIYMRKPDVNFSTGRNSTSVKRCGRGMFDFLGISDEKGTVRKEVYSESSFTKGIPQYETVFYMSNQIKASKFEGKNYLRKGDECQGEKHDDLTEIEADEIKEHKKFISDLVELDTITPSSLGAEFYQRREFMLNQRSKDSHEEMVARTESSAQYLIDQCKTSPSDENCEKMMSFIVKDPLNGSIVGKFRKLARQVYAEAQPQIDDMLWNNAYPSCAAPTDSGSCRSVELYISRFGDGKHSEEAKKLIKNAAPALQRFALIEAEARRVRENREREQESIRFQTCVGTCMGNGNNRVLCERNCR